MSLTLDMRLVGHSFGVIQKMGGSLEEVKYYERNDPWPRIQKARDAQVDSAVEDMRKRLAWA